MANILTIGEYLESHGYDVVVAHDGSEALKKAEEIHPDLILMDIRMPKMNGDEAIAQLKMQPTTRHIPVIICTAFGPGPEVNRAIRAGAAEILHKPFAFSDLENLLLKHVGGEQSRTTSAHQNSPSECTENLIPL